MKKIVALVLALVTVLSLTACFVGCDNAKTVKEEVLIVSVTPDANGKYLVTGTSKDSGETKKFLVSVDLTGCGAVEMQYKESEAEKEIINVDTQKITATNVVSGVIVCVDFYEVCILTYEDHEELGRRYTLNPFGILQADTVNGAIYDGLKTGDVITLYCNSTYGMMVAHHIVKGTSRDLTEEELNFANNYKLYDNMNDKNPYEQ